MMRLALLLAVATMLFPACATPQSRNPAELSFAEPVQVGAYQVSFDSEISTYGRNRISRLIEKAQKEIPEVTLPISLHIYNTYISSTDDDGIPGVTVGATGIDRNGNIALMLSHHFYRASYNYQKSLVRHELIHVYLFHYGLGTTGDPCEKLVHEHIAYRVGASLEKFPMVEREYRNRVKLLGNLLEEKRCDMEKFSELYEVFAKYE